MIAILSPAKTLDEKSPLPKLDFTTPRFLPESEKIMIALKKKSARKLQTLMNINSDLAEVNFQRNQRWEPAMKTAEARPAVRMFKGDVYQGLQAWDWTESDLAFAQDHLVILSGLHGLLRPLDLIRPYRLEMGTSLKVGTRKDLYHFWKGKLTEEINGKLEKEKVPVLVNLASKEYFSALDPKKVKGNILNIHFKEYRNGKYQFMSFFGKKARGLMASYMVKNRVQFPEDLKHFDLEHYAFNPELSSEKDWVFTRES